jgi:predicted Rossmann-fold nucleotide-binding protein
MHPADLTPSTSQEDHTYESYLSRDHYDLVTPDGTLMKLERISPTEATGEVFIHHISPAFVGFHLDLEDVVFNMKSALAQVGIDGRSEEISLDAAAGCAQVRIRLTAIGPLAKALLDQLPIGAKVGKLFAADERRRVRDPDYLSRMFGRSDRHGRPLLSLGGMQGSGDLILDKVDGRTVAYLSLQNGRIEYDDSILGFLPTMAKALCSGQSVRQLLRLHQEWVAHGPRNCEEEELLLVRTLPLHIRTVFGRVVDDLLAKGYRHTSASILQPDTYASGDIYELFGSCKRELTDIPLEFYTLEPHREHVFYQDRDQLQTCLEDGKAILRAFETAPDPDDHRAAVFVVKGEQMINLTEKDWILRENRRHEFPGLDHAMRHALMIDRYIHQQPSFPFLQAMEDDLITSQGVLLVRYLPSPLLKRYLLSPSVQKCIKGVYFLRPSQSGETFFSQEDRALLNDLWSFAIPVYWADESTGSVLQYVQKEHAGSGMFVPLEAIEQFLHATVFGVYGSNLLEGSFDAELTELLRGVQEMRSDMSHELLTKDTPLALVTGGGPGAMEVGNRVARTLGILSCGYIIDFRKKDSDAVINEQQQNPHVEAKMTYRLDRLVERQAEFNLDFPIFLMGGIGTDFEFTLEEVRRKVGSNPPTPVLLFGEPEYWQDKITHRFQRNCESGTIKGSEWISNCFYCIQSAKQGLKVYRDFFAGNLPIGKDHPAHKDGFITVD